MLNESDRYKLENVARSSGYQVVLDLMERECDTAERELLKADPSKTHEVIAAHANARAFRLFFERFQTTVQRELQPQEIAEPVLSPLELMKRQCQ